MNTTIKTSWFETWGRRMVASRRVVLAASGVVLACACGMLMWGAPLKAARIRGIEGDDAAVLIDARLPLQGTAQCTVIFHSETLTTDEPAFSEAVMRALAPLRRHPHVRSVVSPFDPDVSFLFASSLTSVDGHRALALVSLSEDAASDTRLFPGIRGALAPTELDVLWTGVGTFRADLDAVTTEDLVRAETFSTPVTVLVLLFVFGSLVAAGLPVGVGGLAVASGIAAVMLVGRVTEVAHYAVNVASLIGLGVAIDYSLFMVSRFRDELERGLSVEDAVVRTVCTAGRAVAFSGVAVVIGLSGLFFFHGSYLASLGVGGTTVVAFAVLFALTFLPALLAVLGHRINRLRVPFLRWQMDKARWRSIAVFVMKHPLLVLFPTLALLLTAGIPFLKLRTAIPTIDVLPQRAESVRGQHVMREHFPERVATRIAVVAHFPGNFLEKPARVAALYDLTRRLGQIPHVDHVESVVDFDPMLDRQGYLSTLTGPRDGMGETALLATDQMVGRDIAIVSVVTEAPEGSDEARAIVRAIRRQRAVGDGRILVTGSTAMDMDTERYIGERAPYAIAFVMVMTMLVLFVLLRSVLLPIKAVLMNLLSICGSFGALVFVFQEGHFSELLHFTPGPIDPSLPVVLFCATFGLSMDYEVLLLTRMQEEFARTHDNRAAVAEGIAQSGGLITSAAAVMVVVFAAFVGTDLVLLQTLGLGLSLAVALDATIVRVLLVPATMRLFGDWNWWAPAWATRWIDKLGIRH